MDIFDISPFSQPVASNDINGGTKESTSNGNSGTPSSTRGRRDNADAPLEFSNDIDIDITSSIHQLSRQQTDAPLIDVDFNGIGNINLYSNINKEGGNVAMNQQAGNEQAQLSQNNANLEALQQLLNMNYSMPLQIEGGLNTGVQPSSVMGSVNGTTTALLEHQLRVSQLQQLQQLQNQIFQQQMELLNGQTGLQPPLDVNNVFRDPNQYHGLPTPANSTEIRPQIPPNFLSPMTLQTQNYLPPQGPPSQLGTPTALPQGTSSAPAHLAFHTHAPLLSPAELEFELSPLTSPWLGASGYSSQPGVQPQHLSQRNYAQNQNTGNSGQGSGFSNENASSSARAPQPGRRGSKRNASSSGDDASASGPAAGDNHSDRHARKRQSPVIRTAPGNSGLSLGGRRSTSSVRGGSVSMGSTPAMKAVKTQKDSIGLSSDVVGDTPSPVDLSVAMPPPATLPTRPSPGPKEASSSTSSSQVSELDPTLSPITPASIMNLGRLGLGSGLSSSLNPVSEQESDQATSDKSTKKGKEKAQTKATGTTTTRTTRKLASNPISFAQSSSGSGGPEISPSLKPLLPGGLNRNDATHLASASNYEHHVSGAADALHIAPSTPLPPPTPAIRKTSHKAAEQKRRDSLKTSFDDLRLLLPPLPLPSDEGYLEAMGGEQLPGSMPPRGPPRGDASGPNRAVSKLQLLRCGNDFIRRLKDRVVRRDEYIESLRTELRALRIEVDKYRSEAMARGDSEVEKPGDADLTGVFKAFERVDLEKNLDAEEENAPRLGLRIAEGDEADEEGGE